MQFSLALIIAIVFFTGCAGPSRDVLLTDQRTSPGRELTAFAPPEKPSEGQALPIPAPLAGALTLEQALSAGLMHSPELAAFSWEVRGAEARELQAGLLPNPEISTEVENFGGSREMSGFKSAEATVQISQVLELGGKRTSRKRFAERDKNLAGRDYEIKRLDVFAGITSKFWEVLAAQERLHIAESLFKLAGQTYAVAAEKVAVGKAPPVEEVQAGIALATTELEFNKTKNDLEAARSRLAASCGIAAPLFERAEGSLEALDRIPGLENLSALLPESPDMDRWKAEVEKRRAEIQLKDAGAVPDVTLSAGPRYFNENHNKAFVVGFSVPVPLFNRNQGDRREARCSLSKAEEDQRAAALKARADLAQAYQECSLSFSMAATLRDKVLPGAHRAFESAQEGYRQGKFNYLMVLDAQRTLFELKRQHIDALAEYHTAKTALERLTGQKIK